MERESVFFTYDSAITLHNAAHWQAATSYPANGTSLVKEGSPGLAQMAELVAVCLALQQATKVRLPRGYILLTPGLLASAFAVWSG